MNYEELKCSNCEKELKVEENFYDINSMCSTKTPDKKIHVYKRIFDSLKQRFCEKCYSRVFKIKEDEN